jgi:glyoxylase-like metal-dependent hydrolase (beta-lactamase superfamily II)
LLGVTERAFDRRPVEEITPGLWSLPLPMPPPLSVVYAYALETAGSVVLVDSGWNGPDGLGVLVDRLREIGATLEDVTGILLTHGHHDHCGLAPLVRSHVGAWVALHGQDVGLLSHRHEPERLLSWFRSLGLPADHAERLRDWRTARIGARLEPDVVLDEGTRFELGAWSVDTLHTPGHTPGHVCFVDAQAMVMFVGDHILSRITPHVAVTPDHGGNALGSYLHSLDRLRGFNDMLALPGHEERVTVGPRAAEIGAHHEAQLRSVRTELAGGAETVFEVASKMPWSRPWATLDLGSSYSALGEALAHLRVLEDRGLAKRTGSSPVRWRLAEGAPA